MSTKAHTFLLQAKEMPQTTLRINTICNFQTMKIEQTIIEIPNILSRGYSENFLRRQSEAATGGVLYNKVGVLKIFANFAGRQLC